MDNIASYHLNALDKVRYGSNGGRLMIALMFGFCLMTAISIYFMNTSSEIQLSADKMLRRYEVMKKSLKEHEAEKSDLKMDLRDKAKSLEFKKERMQALMETKESIQSEKNDLHLKVGECQIELEFEKRRANNLEDEVNELKKSIGNLNEQQEETEVLLNSHREVEHELNSTILIMEEQLASYKNIVHTLEDEVAALKIQSAINKNSESLQTDSETSVVDAVSQQTDTDYDDSSRKLDVSKKPTESVSNDINDDVNRLTETVTDDETRQTTGTGIDDVNDDVSRQQTETDNSDASRQQTGYVSDDVADDVSRQPTETDYNDETNDDALGTENVLLSPYDPKSINEPVTFEPSDEDQGDLNENRGTDATTEDNPIELFAEEDSNDDDLDYDEYISENFATKNTTLNDTAIIDEKTANIYAYESDNNDMISDDDTFVTDDNDNEDFDDVFTGNAINEEYQRVAELNFYKMEDASENLLTNEEYDKEQPDGVEDVDGVEIFDKEGEDRILVADLNENDDLPEDNDVDFDVITGDEDVDADLANENIF